MSGPKPGSPEFAVKALNGQYSKVHLENASNAAKIMHLEARIEELEDDLSEVLSTLAERIADLEARR